MTSAGSSTPGDQSDQAEKIDQGKTLSDGYRQSGGGCVYCIRESKFLRSCAFLLENADLMMRKDSMSLVAG